MLASRFFPGSTSGGFSLEGHGGVYFIAGTSGHTGVLDAVGVHQPLAFSDVVVGLIALRAVEDSLEANREEFKD